MNKALLPYCQLFSDFETYFQTLSLASFLLWDKCLLSFNCVRMLTSLSFPLRVIDDVTDSTRTRTHTVRARFAGIMRSESVKVTHLFFSNQNNAWSINLNQTCQHTRTYSNISKHIIVSMDAKNWSTEGIFLLTPHLEVISNIKIVLEEDLKLYIVFLLP